MIGMDWQPLGGSTMRMNLNVPLSSYASSVSDIRVGGPSAQLAAVGGRRGGRVRGLRGGGLGREGRAVALAPTLTMTPKLSTRTTAPSRSEPAE